MQLGKEQCKDRAGVERVRVFLQIIFIPLPDSFASLPSKLFDASAVAVSGSFGKMMQVSIPCPLDTDWRQANDTMPSYIAASLTASPSPGHQSLCFPLHLHWDLPTTVRLWTTTTLSVKSKTGKETLSVGLERQKNFIWRASLKNRYVLQEMAIFSPPLSPQLLNTFTFSCRRIFLNAVSSEL